MSVMNIAECLGTAYPLAFTPVNIMSGFKSAGIWPFNRNAFSEADFTPASVTDRPYSEPDKLATSTSDTGVTSTPANADQPQGRSSLTTAAASSVIEDVIVFGSSEAVTEQAASSAGEGGVEDDFFVTGVLLTTGTEATEQLSAAEPDQQSLLCEPPSAEHQPSTSSSPKTIVTPESVRPHPKAGCRKRASTGFRRRGESKILTDTLVKRQLEIEAEEHASKKKKTTKAKKQLQLSKCERKKTPPRKIQQSKPRKLAKRKDDSQCNICQVMYGDPLDNKKVKTGTDVVSAVTGFMTAVRKPTAFWTLVTNLHAAFAYSRRIRLA